MTEDLDVDIEEVFEDNQTIDFVVTGKNSGLIISVNLFKPGNPAAKNERDKVDHFEEKELGNGFKQFITSYLNKDLKSNTPVRIIRADNREVLKEGYAYQLIDALRAGKAYIRLFSGKNYGLMVHGNILHDKPLTNNESIDNIGNVITGTFGKEYVKVYLKKIINFSDSDYK